ncbi:MAG TPA: TolC family protein [Saprospiraceae bacterium]|nr:TolC family protein [Saprospiraceae bacterium]HMQ83936.1 TolC family protein [Saprospiraceae bacterium]
MMHFRSSPSKWLGRLLTGLLLFWFSFPSITEAQTGVSLKRAIEIALFNYPALKIDQQFIEQQLALVDAVQSTPPTQLFFTGEQMSTGFTSGIQSFGLQQNLNWPGSRQPKEELVRERANLGNAYLEVDAFLLKKEITQAYYEVVYARQWKNFNQQQVDFYAELIELAQTRFDLGETSKIPVLSATSKLKAVQWQLERSSQNAVLTEVIFNNWLYSDTLYTIYDNQLPAPEMPRNWFVQGGHPELLLQQQQIKVSESTVDAEKSYTLPQITMGGQFQMIDGDIPFYGYQLGLNIPLGQKATKARMEAAQLATEMGKASLEQTRLELENEKKRLVAALEAAWQSLVFIQTERLPLADVQIEDAKKAYSQGAVDYHDYLTNLEQGLEAKRQYLESWHEFHRLKVELEFLCGRR